MEKYEETESKFLERLNSLFDSDPRTDTAIGDALGVSKQTISYWRQGERSPKKTMVLEIARMYHVSPVWLMGFDDEMAVPLYRMISVEEERLIAAWREADDRARQDALFTLQSHPRK